MKSQPESKFSKIATTTIIWGCATLMLAICIPLVAVTKSGIILPLVLILGASGSTIAIWQTFDRPNQKMARLHEDLKILNDRVVDLETICSSDDFNVQKRFKQMESNDSFRSS